MDQPKVQVKQIDEYLPHPQSFLNDFIGFLQVIFIGLTFIIPAMYINQNCEKTITQEPTLLQKLCNEALTSPLLANFALMTFMISICMWILTLITNSVWIIDPYWTLTPVFIFFFYRNHPTSLYDSTRSNLVIALLLIWSIRLTYSYLRRENFQLGSREDWRFADMRKQFGEFTFRVFISLTAAYFFQQVLLYGMTLPIYAVHTSDQPLNVYDLFGTALSLLGIICESFADAQLRTFMLKNENRVRQGKEKILVLNEGLWYFSRHPNYFGEQCFWYGLAVMAIGIGQTWTIIGGLALSGLFFGPSLKLVEDRMLKNEKRKKAYVEYMNDTSPIIPFFKYSSLGKSKTN